MGTTLAPSQGARETTRAACWEKQRTRIYGRRWVGGQQPDGRPCLRPSVPGEGTLLTACCLVGQRHPRCRPPWEGIPAVSRGSPGPAPGSTSHPGRTGDRPWGRGTRAAGREGWGAEGGLGLSLSGRPSPHRPPPAARGPLWRGSGGRRANPRPPHMCSRCFQNNSVLTAPAWPPGCFPAPETRPVSEGQADRPEWP